MSNPFESPQTSIGSSEKHVPWTTSKVFQFALLPTAIGNLAGGFIHLSLGLPLVDILMENLVWQLLLLSFGVLTLWALRVVVSSPRVADYSRVLRCSIGLNAILILALLLFDWINTYYFQLPRNRILFSIRAFGDHIRYYWLMVSLFGLLPAILLWPRLQKLDRVAVPISILLIPATAFYLRTNFLIHYSDELPSTWHQFCWPF